MHNEEGSVIPLYKALTAVLITAEVTWEFVAVDDGSRDATRQMLRKLATDDPRVRTIFFQRNFGKEAAILAGLRHATGRCAVLMDADLQHPPSLIPEMIRVWNGGTRACVVARRRKRGRRSPAYRIFAAVFYGTMALATGLNLEDYSDFQLLDRSAIDVLIALPERRRFHRGLVAWTGFDVAWLDFEVAARVAGESRWSTMALLRYALDNLTSFTTVPLTLTAVAGALTTGVGVLLGLWTLGVYASGHAVSGFTTVILLQVIFSGTLLLAVGVVALYLARAFEELKDRPVYIIEPDE